MRGSRALLFAFTLVALVRAQTTPISYIVKYRESVPLAAISSGGADALTGEAGRALAEATTVPLAAGDAASDPRLGRIVVAELERPLSKEALDLIAADPAVEYAYQSRALKIDEIPNDSLADEQWALAKIDALTAWKTTRGEGIVVAVIDTGIDYLHPDIADNVRVNAGETGTDGAGRDRRENGIDDDGNGYIDDWIGYDFVHREGFPDDPNAGDFRDWDNDPYDENSHGSAVAGIIAAIADNEIGVAGVAPNARILGVRAFDPEGYGDEEDAAAAIVYAVQAGADVINMSFGDDFFSLVLRDVVRYAAERGVTLVASSGNDGTDAPHYPSGFDDVISVGNSTSRDYVALNSSHGSTLDLVAPGSEIMTLDLGGGYRFVSGTSAAAPHVSAVAAALLSVGDFTPEEIRQILKTTSDDVLEPGWDDRSGAGRLNFAKAVGSQAPAAIRFHAPAQDYASRGEILDVRATILAPMFRSFDLDFGVGDNPATWTALVEDRRRQASDEIIARLDLTSHSDTVYTLRILVTLTNGRTLEERVNFRVAAHAPVVEPIGFGPAYLADRPTIITALFTDQPAAVRMRYRLVGAGAWRSVSLDGFSLGAIHVRNFHYGYAPVEEIEPGAEYEIFFEAENLAGLVGSAKRESGDPFVVETAPLQTPRPAEDAGFSLPPGTPFPYAFSLGDGKLTAAVFEVSEEGAATVFYDFENGAFAPRGDSLAGLILKEIGDFDGDGLKDALAFAGYRGRLLEQTAPGSSEFVEKYDSGEDRFFWPVMARDIDGDGAVEVVAFESDTSMSVFSISGDLELTRETTVYNFSENAFGNSFNAARALLIDADEDGFNELWVADIDGDVMRYEVRAKDDVRNMDVVESGFFGSSNFLAAGDFNGDGTLDVAALFESIDEIDVAPYNRLLIYNIVDGELHSVYDYAFLDETRDFRSYQATNALEFADLDADGDDELIGFFFPHAYVFDWRADGTRIVFHEDGVASSSVLASDFDADGALEVALPKPDGIVFREFFQSDAPPAPVDCRGYSVDSATVRVEWRGAADRYRLLKGDAPNALVVIDTVLADSTQTGAYLDGDATIGETYYYAVRSEIDSLADPLSPLSNVAEAYHHVPGTLVAARAETPRAVRLTFSEKTPRALTRRDAIRLERADDPTDVRAPSSAAPAGEREWIVSFEEPLVEATYRVVVAEWEDFYGSPIAEASAEFAYVPPVDQEELFLEAFEVLDPYRIRLTFNLPLDSATATDPANYVFNPANAARTATLDPSDARTATLDLKGAGNPVGSVGRAYRLKIVGVRSSDASGAVPIVEGAGSVATLASVRESISDVFVYPSPAILSRHDRVTFANLPRYAEIVVYTVSGTRVATVEESDGDGGTTWDLRDEQGRLVPGGVYWYRAARLDANGEEQETKLGKFAVIR